MEPQHQSSHATPGRRRQNRQSAHASYSPANTTYLSENDMANDLQFPIEVASGGPSTPRKSASNSPAPFSQPAASKTKTRNGNKTKQKHASTSPGPAKQGRHTPPNAGPSRSAAAFAGATFHASPAPSSLPIPSFLAKAMDSPGLKTSGQVSQEPSPPPTDSEPPTPQPAPPTSRPGREESPLDLFFRADRAEKERARSTSSASALATASGPFSPPSSSRSPQNSKPAPPSSNSSTRRSNLQRGSSTGISSTELDGTPARVIGPAFSTPYQERIKAAYSNEKQRTAPSPATEHPAQIGDRTEALKKFLALGSHSGSNVAKPAEHPNMQSNGSRSPFGDLARPQVQTAPVATAPGHDSGRAPDLLQMEDSLRKILKLGSGPTA